MNYEEGTSEPRSMLPVFGRHQWPAGSIIASLAVAAVAGVSGRNVVGEPGLYHPATYWLLVLVIAGSAGIVGWIIPCLTPSAKASFSVLAAVLAVAAAIVLMITQVDRALVNRAIADSEGWTLDLFGLHAEVRLVDDPDAGYPLRLEEHLDRDVLNVQSDVLSGLRECREDKCILTIRYTTVEPRIAILLAVAVSAGVNLSSGFLRLRSKSC